MIDPQTTVNLKRSWIVAIALSLTCVAGYIVHSQNALEKPSREQMAEAFPADADKILESASEITLYSLWNTGGVPMSEQELGPNTFHDNKVLGKMTLKSEEKQQLIAHFYDAIAEPTFRGACFAPHHGIRIKQKGKTVDFLICFSCHQFITYGLGSEKETAKIGERDKNYFNSVLTNAGIEVQEVK